MTLRALFQNSPLEFQLAAACCQWPESESRTERLSTLTTASIDWSLFLRLVERHRIGGLVHLSLKERFSVSADVRSNISASASRIAKQNLLSIGVAAQLARQFEQTGLPFLVIKGAPLAMLAYGNCTTRHSKDIDLLVRPEEVLQAEKILATAGFQRAGLASSLGSSQEALWMRTRKHFEYVHQATRTRVELHWRISDNRAVPATDILAARAWVTVAPGIDLPTLQRTELLLQLCAHGASHTWFRLKWLADIAALLAEETPQSMAGIHETACRRDFDRPLHQAFLLCESLFETPHALLPVKPSATVRWMARVAARALLAEDHKASSSSQAEFVPRGQTMLHFFLRRSWRYRLEDVRVNASSPVDWHTLQLPLRLQFLYPVLRLPLWLKRKFAAKSHPERRAS